MNQQTSLPYFHIESFGAVDGPGTRLVIFSQGCFLRCVYCHNPESWDLNRNKLITVDEILDKYERNKEFYAKGGITISGGEPTIHSKFIIELFKECQKRNIHTCIDTCGFTFKKESIQRYEEMDEFTDLWIVDIKHVDREGHKKVTGFAEQRELDLVNWLEERKRPYWLRQVILRDYTDKKEHLQKLGRFIKGLKYMQKFEVLPFHNMAEPKYENLKMDYPLKGEPGTTKEGAIKAMKAIKEGMEQS